MGWCGVGWDGAGRNRGTGWCSEVGPVAEIKGVEDVNDIERRGVEDVDGAAGVDDFDGAAGVNDVGKGAGRDGRSLLAFVFVAQGV